MTVKRHIALATALLVASLAAAQEEPRATAPADGPSAYSLEVETGAGFDSNSFEAPQDSYTDPVAGTIAVVSKPGFFVPFALDTQYVLERGNFTFVPALKFRSAVFPVADTRTATRYYLKVEPAIELVLGRKGRLKNTLFFDPFFVFKRSTYVDHDTGVEVANQGQLYSYTSFGGEAAFRFRTWKPFGWEVAAGAQRRDYSEVLGTVTGTDLSLDRTELFGTAELSYEIFKPTDLSAAYTVSFDNYDHRHARDLTGSIIDTVLLDYLYHDVELTLRHRFSRQLAAYLDYTLTLRDDPYMGYNDYVKHEMGVRGIFKTDRLKIRLSGSYWDKSYPRAFAFDEPGQPLKHFQTWEADLGIDVELTPNWGLWADYGYINQSSTDPRYDYEQHQAGLGARFAL